MAQRMQCVTGPPPTHQFATAMHRRTTNTLPIDEPLLADTSRRFVRLIEERSDGLIAFEFSIGWPELAVELLLPTAAFAEFCARNKVQRLDD